MRKPHILHVDENHPLLIEGLKNMGYENVIEYDTPLEKLIPNLNIYQGLVIRSRFPIDKKFLGPQKHTKIGRHSSAPLKRYLYTSFLFALEINIFVLLLLRFCSTRLLLIKACVKSLCLLANEGWRCVLRR